MSLFIEDEERMCEKMRKMRRRGRGENEEESDVLLATNISSYSNSFCSSKSGGGGSSC